MEIEAFFLAGPMFRYLAKYRRLLLLAVVAFQATAQSNQDVLLVEADQPFTSLAPYLERVEDPNGLRRLSDVKRLDWFVSRERVNLGFTDSVWWFRFRLANHGFTPLKLNLDIGFPQLDDVQVYVPGMDMVQLGDAFPYDIRPVNTRTFMVPMSLERGVHEIYVRVKTSSAFSVPLAVVSPEHHLERLAREQTYLGVFYGVALALILYNLALFIGTREPAYGIFVVTSLFMAVSAAVFDGMAFPFWGESTYWHNRSIAFMIGGMMMGLTQFIRYYLDIQGEHLRMDRFLRWKSAIWLVLMVGVLFLSPNVGVRILAPLAGAGFVTLTAVSLWRWRQGATMAGYFLAAAGALFLMGLLAAFAASGVIGGFYVISLLGMKIAYALLMILLSFGQAHRIRLLKSMELEANAEVHRARAESEAKSSFLAQMSHELRTPMNAVLGIVELLRDTPLNKRQTEHLDVITSAGRSLLSVIDDILDYARLESGKVTLCAEPFHLQALMQSCFDMFSKGVAKEGVALKFDYDPAIPAYIVGDSGRLRQVMVNLLGNALKFTHQGHVTFKVSSQIGDEASHTVLFEVIDSGIGISNNKARELFQAFTQADTRTTREYGGTGLGLSISSQLVALMGGELQVQSELGVGSRFFFAIDFELAEAPAEVVPLESSERKLHLDFSRLRVLVVEDNRLNRRVVQGFLKRLQIEPDFAVNGQEALDALKQASFDLVFMDCEMPIIDGFEATRQIRTWEREQGRSKTLVVALTAHALNEHRHKAIACGMDDYLAKPLIFNDLERLLVRYFRTSVGLRNHG